MRGRVGIAILFALLLSQNVARGEERWPDERRAGPFVIHADFALRQIEPLIEQLAALQSDVDRALGVGTAREEIHLFLFQRKSTYLAYLREYFPTAPDRRALFIKQRGPGMVFAYRSDELDVDLRHECTHALLHANLSVVPLWLDEGLAEYFEVPPKDRAFDNPHLSSVRWKRRFGSLTPITELERIEELEGMGRTEYRDAWAWVHFMLHGPEPARDELRRYLRDIRELNPPGQLSTRLARSLPDVDEHFSRHFREWSR